MHCSDWNPASKISTVSLGSLIGAPNKYSTYSRLRHYISPIDSPKWWASHWENHKNRHLTTGLGGANLGLPWLSLRPRLCKLDLKRIPRSPRRMVVILWIFQRNNHEIIPILESSLTIQNGQCYLLWKESIAYSRSANEPFGFWTGPYVAINQLSFISSGI